MLIRKETDLKRVMQARKTDRLYCDVCRQAVGVPPAVLVELWGEQRIYHPKCAMDLVYSILAAMTGYSSAQPSKADTPPA